MCLCVVGGWCVCVFFPYLSAVLTLEGPAIGMCTSQTHTLNSYGSAWFSMLGVVWKHLVLEHVKTIVGNSENSLGKLLVFQEEFSVLGKKIYLRFAHFQKTNPFFTSSCSVCDRLHIFLFSHSVVLIHHSRSLNFKNGLKQITSFHWHTTATFSSGYNGGKGCLTVYTISNCCLIWVFPMYVARAV